MKNKKFIRQKISYFICTIAGMWILAMVFFHYDSLSLFTRISFIFVGTVTTIFNGYYYAKSRARQKGKTNSNKDRHYTRVELDNLNESYKQGLITTEEYKKLSSEILSNN